METQPPTSGFQLRRPLRRQAPDTLCPAQGAAGTRERAPGHTRAPRFPRRRRGPCLFLQAAPRGSRRAPRPRRAGGLRSQRTGTNPRLASQLRAERAQGRPKVRGGLSAPPARPSGEEGEGGAAGRSCGFGDGGAIWGPENLRGVSVVKAGSTGAGSLCSPPGSVCGRRTSARDARRGLRVSLRKGGHTGVSLSPQPTWVCVWLCVCGVTPGALQDLILLASVCVGDTAGTPSPGCPGSVHAAGGGTSPAPRLGACGLRGRRAAPRASPTSRVAPSSASPLRALGDLPNPVAAAGGGRGLGAGGWGPNS